MVAYKSLKTVENYKIVSTKSSRCGLRKVIVYEKLRLSDFDWENFGVLDWYVVAYEEIVAHGGPSTAHCHRFNFRMNPPYTDVPA